MRMTHIACLVRSALLGSTLLAVLLTLVLHSEGESQAPVTFPDAPLVLNHYAKFPAGSHFDLHWHTHTEYVAVVSGNDTIVLGEETHSLSTGSYIVIPARMNHSWDVPRGGEDSVILVRRRGPADFNFVEP